MVPDRRTPENDRFQQALGLLKQIERMMSDEHEGNWIHGIWVMIDRLEVAQGDRQLEGSALVACAATYRTIMGARDGFGDYLIWREDLESRVKINQDFDALRSELWAILVQ